MGVLSTHSNTTMRAFITVFLAVAVSGEADPYTIGQVLTGQTAGGVITGVTYGHGLGKVAGFPYTAVHAVAPVVHHGYSAGYPFVYGKREAEAEPEPYTVGQIAAGAHIASAIADGRPHNVGVIPNAAIAPVYHHRYAGYPYIYGKREAEPFYGVLPYVPHAGIVANTGLGHAVAVTGYGHVTHSSNVGVCTNVAGVQVPCLVEKEQERD